MVRREAVSGLERVWHWKEPGSGVWEWEKEVDQGYRHKVAEMRKICLGLGIMEF